MAAVNKIFQSMMKCKGFSSEILRGATITNVTPEVLQMTVPVTADKCNMIDTLHGGYTASFVDIVSTLDLIRLGNPAGVSVELSVQYLSAAPIETTVIFESRLVKIGKKLAFCEVDVKDQSSNKLLAKGKHIKYLL